MKKKMIKIRLMSLAIWLLFLISGLSHSLSHALQDNTDEPRLPVGGVKSFESSLQEETLLGFDAIGLRKMGNGRKRVAVVQRMKKQTTAANDEREEGQDSSRISGLKKKSSNKSLVRSQVNNQQAQAAEDQTTRRSNNSQHSRAKSTKFSYKRPSARDEETRKLLKAAKEIANLMHKDYKDWAHRKPPINNREPLH